MKRNLLLLLLVVPVVFSACTKTVIRDGNTLVGQWVLDYAEKSDGYRSTTIYTGYEQGLFSFYGNGQAVYDDGYEVMKGSWNLRWVNDSYYDTHGVYHSGSRQVFSLHLQNYSGSRVIDWDFDEAWFSNSNTFNSTYYGTTYDYKYVFARY